MTKLILLICVSMLAACSSNDDHHDDGNSALHDPSVLIDVYEREVKLDCGGATVSDSVIRHAATSGIKINPQQNIYVAAVSFFNLDNGDEFTPSGVWIPGPGGDNLKWATFCQAPQPSSPNCLVVHDGDNRIQYKYWSQENPDVMGETGTRVLHFTVSSETSSRICTRSPKICPMGATPEYGDCQY